MSKVYPLPLLLCLSLKSGVTLLSYLPGCCHFVLDTGLSTLVFKITLSIGKERLVFSHHRDILSYLCLFLPNLCLSIHTFCPLSISICAFPFSPSLPSSSILTFPLRCFHHSRVLKLHVSLSTPQRKEMLALNCGPSPWT